MTTLCFHKVKEEAGNSKSLLDAVHGDGITGRLCLGVPTQEQALKKPCLGVELQQCPTPRSCRKRSTFLRGHLGLQGQEGAQQD